MVAPKSAVDIGCGTGLILARLAEKGCRVLGVEGSVSAIKMSPIKEHLQRWNLQRPLPPLGRFDIAICTEVAEHLPPNAAPVLVSGLTQLSDTIVFTAARPGQGGRHHLNEQPQPYWEALFVEARFSRSPQDEQYLRDATADISRAAFRDKPNLMIFLEAGSQARSA